MKHFFTVLILVAVLSPLSAFAVTQNQLITVMQGCENTAQLTGGGENCITGALPDGNVSAQQVSTALTSCRTSGAINTAQSTCVSQGVAALTPATGGGSPQATTVVSSASQCVATGSGAVQVRTYCCANGVPGNVSTIQSQCLQRGIAETCNDYPGKPNQFLLCTPTTAPQQQNNGSGSSAQNTGGGSTQTSTGQAPNYNASTEGREFMSIVPIPGVTGQNLNFAQYVNQLFKIALSIGGILAVMMIVWGGFEYMTSAAAGEKKDGAKRIQGAVTGLILLLASYLILFVINPCLVEINAFTSGSPDCSPPPAQTQAVQPPQSTAQDPYISGQTDASGRRAVTLRVGMCLPGQQAPIIDCSGAIPVCRNTTQGGLWERSGETCQEGETPTVVCPYGCDETRPIISLSPAPDGFNVGSGATMPGVCEASNGTVREYCCKQNRTVCYQKVGATACETGRETVPACVQPDN